MRLSGNVANNYIHTQEIRFVGEEAVAFLAWHQRWTLTLSPLPGDEKKEAAYEHV